MQEEARQVASAGPLVVPAPSRAEPRLVRPPCWCFAFPAAVAYLGLFFLLPLGPFLFRFIQRAVGWGLLGTLVATAALTGMFFLLWYGSYLLFPPEEERVLAEKLPRLWFMRLQRKTGLLQVHSQAGGLLLGLLAALCIWQGAWFVVPALAAAGVGLAGLARVGGSNPWVLRHQGKPITLPPPVETPGPPDAEEREFAWSYQRVSGQEVKNSATLALSPSQVQQLRLSNPWAQGALPATLPEVGAHLVNQGTSFEVRQLARYLVRQAGTHRFSFYEEMDNALRMVQQTVEYKLDEESTNYKEYWRWPVETLWDRMGDCDCKSVLLASLYQALFTLEPSREPLEVVLLILPEEAHMAVAVEAPQGWKGAPLTLAGKTFLYCESTADQMRLGEAPPDWDLAQCIVIRLVPEAD